MNITPVQNNYNFCGIFNNRKNKKRPPQHLKSSKRPQTQKESQRPQEREARTKEYRPFPPVQSECNYTAEGIFLNKIRIGTDARIKNLKMEPGTLYFVDDDTKFLLGHTMEIDLQTPEIQSVLKDMEYGESFIIGRSANLGEKCPPEVSRMHLKLTKAAEGCYMVTDMNSTNGSVILKNVLPVERTDRMRTLHTKQRYLMNENSVIRLNSATECKLADYDFSSLSYGDKATIYKGQLKFLDDTFMSEKEKREEALTVQKGVGKNLIVMISPTYIAPFYWGIEESDLPENELIKPGKPRREVKIPVKTIESAISDDLAKSKYYTGKQATQQTLTSVSQIPADSTPEIRPAARKQLSYDAKVNGITYLYRAYYEDRKLASVAITAKNIKTDGSRTICAGQIYPASQFDKIPEELRQHLLLELDDSFILDDDDENGENE